MALHTSAEQERHHLQFPAFSHEHELVMHVASKVPALGLPGLQDPEHHYRTPQGILRNVGLDTSAIDSKRYRKTLKILSFFTHFLTHPSDKCLFLDLRHF